MTFGDSNGRKITKIKKDAAAAVIGLVLFIVPLLARAEQEVTLKLRGTLAYLQAGNVNLSA
jgi:hypothetical protein